MAASVLSMKITGPLLSELMLQSYREKSNCNGFLYGELVSTTKNEITDSQHTTITHSFICVSDYQPMSKTEFFSKYSGQKSDAWKPDTQQNSQIVGLYSVRKSTNSLSLLEKSMHKTLCKHLSKPNIVTFLITRGENMEATCLSWDMKAFIQNSSGKFSVIRFSVMNLHGSLSNSYIVDPNPSATAISSRTRGILDSFESSISDGEHIKFVQATRDVTMKLIEEFDHTIDELVENEKIYEKELKENAALKEELARLQAITGIVPLNSPVAPLMDIDNRSLLTSQSSQESEYGRAKRLSMEDIKLRSPVVLLKKIDDLEDKAISEMPSSSSEEKSSCKNPNVARELTKTVTEKDDIKLDDASD